MGETLSLDPGASATFAGLLLPKTTLTLSTGNPSARIQVTIELDQRAALSRVFEPEAEAWVLPADFHGFARVTFTSLGLENATRQSPVRLKTELTTRRAGSTPSTRASERIAAKNVILYVVDTVRWDQVGESGATSSNAPNLHALAETATFFANARAQAPWTRASVASMLTGLRPWRHRANAGGERLADSLDTLAEVLAEAGLTTAAFTTNGNVAPSLGFAQGFDHFDYLREHGPKIHVPADALHGRVLQWLGTLSEDQNFFLWIHATDPHAPYTPDSQPSSGIDEAARLRLRSTEFLMQIYKSRKELPGPELEHLLDLYGAEVRAWDAELGRLMAALVERQLLAETLLIVVADHGEEFFDHGGWQHSTSVFEEVIKVPLVIRLPGAGPSDGRVTDHHAEHVDVFPTVLDVLDLPVNSDIDGKSLLPYLRGEPADRLSPQISSLETRQHVVAESIALYGHKLVRTWASGRHQSLALYDLTNDQRETTDLTSSKPIATEALRLLLEAATFSRSLGVESDPEQLDPELASTLRVLGYVQ
ncbi:MAG TPA: sulfatase [Thermoanaerobaculia bacterium]|nr:sulfatase [Thermoanaerobaculia bacterium]